MAKIKLSEGGFTLIPEGVTTFKIVGAKYDEDFGKLEIEMQTKSGLKHTEKYSLLNKDGEVNQKAVNAFSWHGIGWVLSRCFIACMQAD